MNRFANILLAVAAICCAAVAQAKEKPLEISEAGYFEKRGLNVLVFSNWYDSLFSDSKISGVELIHHGMRTATNGDVRLSATPGQWDPIGIFKDRQVDRENGTIEAHLSYPDQDYPYTIRVERDGDGVRIAVIVEKPLPPELDGRAGFNLEFLPSAYWGKTFLADDKSGLLPHYASSDMADPVNGLAEPLPLASGNTITLAAGDVKRRVRIASKAGEISLYDGRNQAQNGWFVLREMIPSGKSGRVIEWSLSASTVKNWTRKPVVSFSQVGYLPNRDKVAIIERDPNSKRVRKARILKVSADGSRKKAFEGAVKSWGRYLRYDYDTFDFSKVNEPGIYVIDYDGEQSAPFRIAEDVYDGTWHATMDVFFPAQMDHMFVNEGYRVWHGASHLDDALQAPVDHEHHDLYRQGPTTDTKFKPLEHIPGLNVGGWYDAGDYDIRTQSQYATIRSLVASFETFGLTRDQTKVDKKRARVDMHLPDGKPDMLQQIEHGVLQLVAQHNAVGHAIHGIVEPDLDQYTHLGDGVTKTDNRIYDADLGPDDVKGNRSGRLDDRWAFTSKSSALNYGSVAGMAAAARVLGDHNPDLAREALEIAERVFAEEQGKEPDLFRHGNTTGGPLPAEQFTAAAELLLATKKPIYAEAAEAIWPEASRFFGFVARDAIRILPLMPESYRAQIREATQTYLTNNKEAWEENPFGVRITRGGWAGGAAVVYEAITQYMIHTAFPDLIDREDIYKRLDYIFGRHPAHNLSLVSGIGAQTKKVAYGTNRADFSYIAGGVVPGILILKPDFPENHEDWPFFWGQNEYVITITSQYVYLVNAAAALARQ